MRRSWTPMLLMSAAALIAAASTGQTAPENPTFTKDVAPIFFNRCTNCHRPNDIAPMSMLTYEEVRPWVKAIRSNVAEKTMPPWHADPGFGPFSNDRSMPQDEIDTIVRWVDQGSKRGNPADMPEPPALADAEWRLGEPDYIIEFEEIAIPGGGPDRFHDLIAKTNLPEDKWITAVEIIPGNRQVLHHTILWQGEDRSNPDPAGWIGAWAAGAEPVTMPKGTGRLLRKGESIIGDMHYHPTEFDATDQTKIGFHFAEKDEIEKELINLWVMNVSFVIPPGDDNYEAKSTHTFAQDSHVYGLTPHMHYRGKDFDFTVTYPDGRVDKLLEVSNYDFNWQTGYTFEEPLAMPKGARIDCVAHWDNSADNPSNPDSTKTVTFGNESYDEMMIGFVDYTVDEGVRPMAVAHIVEPTMFQLAEQFPGEIYKVMVPMNGKLSLTALHLPREGNGGWHVPFGGIVGRAAVSNIVWDGDKFEAIITIPGQGENAVKGSASEDGSKISFTMKQGDGPAFPIAGSLVTAEMATSSAGE